MLVPPGAERYVGIMAEAIGNHWGPTAVLAFIFGAIVMVASLGSLAVTLLTIAGLLF